MSEDSVDNGSSSGAIGKNGLKGPSGASRAWDGALAGGTFFAGALSVIGAFGLWAWAIYLFLENWGLFWAIGTFLFFPLAFIVVAMCFFWGVPYFFVAFIAWTAATVSMGMSEEERQRRFIPLTLAISLGFGSWAGYLGWQDHTTPDPIDKRELSRLTDDSIAVAAVLRASQDDEDVEWVLKRNRAQSRLREDLANHDTARIDEIVAMVTGYLEYERSLEHDMRSFLSDFLADRQSTFKTSVATQAALNAMPQRMRDEVMHDEMVQAFLMAFQDIAPEELPEDVERVMQLSIERKWTRYAMVYEDLLGRAMPEFP